MTREIKWGAVICVINRVTLKLFKITLVEVWGFILILLFTEM